MWEYRINHNKWWISGYFYTFNIGQGNKEVCLHFNSQPCSQAVIIFDADYLKYKQKFH